MEEFQQFYTRHICLLTNNTPFYPSFPGIRSSSYPPSHRRPGLSRDRPCEQKQTFCIQNSDSEA
jgi:hypothetical protein